MNLWLQKEFNSANHKIFQRDIMINKIQLLQNLFIN